MTPASKRRPDPGPTLSIFPDQIHIGDRFTDADVDGPAEWEVASRPVTFKKGHEVRARVQRPGDPETDRVHAARGGAPAGQASARTVDVVKTAPARLTVVAGGF